jgi:hypothetical protein
MDWRSSSWSSIEELNYQRFSIFSSFFEPDCPERIGPLYYCSGCKEDDSSSKSKKMKYVQVDSGEIEII